MVSENAARVPVLETANTVPVTVPSPVKALLLVPKLEGLIATAPKLLPIKALSPEGSKSSELGGVGKKFAAPGVAFAVETLYMAELQVVGDWAEHPVLVASRDAVGVAPVIRPEIAPSPTAGVGTPLLAYGVAYTGTGMSCWQLMS